MDILTFEYPAAKEIAGRAHVGVVGSGDLEILVEPSTEKRAQIIVRTTVEGFGETWKAVFERFLHLHDVAAKIEINDFGATPGVVSLRLAQAFEALER